jgi:hypothetical protein
MGSLLLSNAETVECLMLGRFVVGWAVAVSGIADVTYLHEISSVWEKRNGVREDGRIATGEERAADAFNTEGGQSTEGAIVSVDAQNNGTGGRGSVVSVNEACISLGFLLAYGMAALGGASQHATDTNEQVSAAWRVMFGFGGFLAALQFFGMLFMPESPVWLHEKGRFQDAVSARNKIRGTLVASGDNYIESTSVAHHHETNGGSSRESPYQNGTQHRSESIGIEMHAISLSLSEEEEQPNVSPRLHNANAADCIVNLWIKVRSTPSQVKVYYRRMVPYRNQCIIAFVLATSQQFCGHPSILSFAPEIFAMLSRSPEEYQAAAPGDANNSTNLAASFLADPTLTYQTSIELTPIELTVGIGLLKFLTTCLVILFIERGGRRLWLLSGMSCILVSLTFLRISFSGRDGDETAHNSDDTPQLSSSLKYKLGIVGIYGVAIGYAASFGPLTWLIVSELFPSSIRGRALGFATVVTYMAAGLVSNTFLGLAEEFGISTCFALYWTSTFVSIVFVWLAVPDTGGEKSAEEIGEELMRMWIWGGKRHGRGRSSDGDDEKSSPKRTSWTFLRCYGSGGRSNNHDIIVSPDEAGASSAAVSSQFNHPGLKPRRSLS